MNMESKDLIIRETLFDDLNLFYEWERLPEVTEYFSIKENQSKEEILHKFFTDQDDPATLQFTILLKRENDEPAIIGRIVLEDIIADWKAELWRIYIGDPDLRGKGYGRQALELIMEYCFNELNLERLYLDHYTGNPAAYLYEKLGFKPEGVLRSNCRKDGILYDVHILSMLKDEYLARS